MNTLRACAFLLAMAGLGARADEPPRTYALVSAIGSTFLYVKPRMSTGTHMEAYQRAEMTVPDTSLDAAALRGLEKIVKLSDPTAKFVYLRLNPEEFAKIDAPQKGAVAVGKLASAFDRMPERKDWYQILVVTPRYVASERAGLGSKLSGIGVYVQPLDRGVLGQNGAIGADPYTDEPGEGAVTPDGKPVQSGSFVAPFFYTQVWVLDAATLQVIHTTERFDFQRIRDPSVASIKIENEVPPEKLGPMVETFVEQASARAAREAIGVVTVGEPKVVRPR
jgi:hypothetical protein